MNSNCTIILFCHMVWGFIKYICCNSHRMITIELEIVRILLGNISEQMMHVSTDTRRFHPTWTNRRRRRSGMTESEIVGINMPPTTWSIINKPYLSLLTSPGIEIPCNTMHCFRISTRYIQYSVSRNKKLYSCLKATASSNQETQRTWRNSKNIWGQGSYRIIPLNTSRSLRCISLIFFISTNPIISNMFRWLTTTSCSWVITIGWLVVKSCSCFHPTICTSGFKIPSNISTQSSTRRFQPTRTQQRQNRAFALILTFPGVETVCRFRCSSGQVSYGF